VEGVSGALDRVELLALRGGGAPVLGTGHRGRCSNSCIPCTTVMPASGVHPSGQISLGMLL
jgi:hypothetical protein